MAIFLSKLYNHEHKQIIDEFHICHRCNPSVKVISNHSQFKSLLETINSPNKLSVSSFQFNSIIQHSP